jgi:hypothetical protein
MDSFKTKLNNVQNTNDLHVVFLNIISGMMEAYTEEDKDIIYICLDYAFYHLDELLQCYRIIDEGTKNPKAVSRLNLISDLLPLDNYLRDKCNEKILKYNTFKGKLSVLRKYVKKIDPTLIRLKEKLEKIKKEFRVRKGLNKDEVECVLDFLAKEVPLIVDIFCDRADFAKRVLKQKTIYSKFHCKYKYSDNSEDETEKTNTVLQILESITGSSTGFTLVNGNVQSGKSNLLRCISLFEILQGQSCVLIVRNFTADYKQMLNGIKIFNKRYRKYMKSVGYGSPKVLIEVLYGDKIDETFLKVFTTEPKLIIILANKIQASRLNNFLDDYSDEIEHFSVLIDEMDIHGYPSDTDVSTHEQIQILMQRATSIFGTTATAFDIIFQEDDLKNDRMFSLPNTVNYRGIPNIVFKKLTENAKPPPRIKKDEEYDVLENDGNLKKIYYEMADKLPEWQKNYNTPIICLHKTTENTEYHSRLFKWFINDEKLNKAFAIIIFNGNGCRVYHYTLKNKEIIIDGIKSSSTKEEQEAGIHLFKNSAIQEVYQWFKDNGGTNKYRKIVTISGKMAARGINFVSADYEWHLSHMYYLAAKSTPIPELIQAMRLCGIYTDDCMPLKCYSTEETISEIKKGYNIQKDILSRAQEAQEVINTKLWVRDLTFNKGKVPKRQLTKGIKINKEIKKIDNKKNDGGISYKEFTEQVKKNITEDVWKEKYEYLRETEGNENGNCFKIKSNDLISSHKNIYEEIIEYILEYYGTEKWISRAEIIENLVSVHKRKLHTVAGILTKWCQQKSTKCYSHKDGLLFQKIEKNWFIRLN